MLSRRYPRDIVVDTYSTDEISVSLTRSTVKAVLDKYGETPENILHYTYLEISGGFVGSEVILDPNRIDEIENSLTPDIRQLFIITLADYNRLMGRNETLSDGEAIIYTTKKGYSYDTLTITEYGTFQIKKQAEAFVPNGVDAAQIIPSVFIFVKDEAVVKELYDLQLGIYGENSSDMIDHYAFDLSCDAYKQIEITKELSDSIIRLREERPDDWAGVGMDGFESSKSDFYALYGGMFFLGILFGTVFIAAAVLIMYYKQISEGFEDKEKFGILQKVGMTKDEIRRSINSQVLTVFFAPLAAAGVHMAFAFGIVSKLLMLFGLTDRKLFAIVTLCCFVLFGILYTAVYMLTSSSYYKIVSERE